MHKDGFTFDSQDVVGPRGGEGVIVNLRRDENKRFRNGNSRFIFPRRFPLPLSLSLSLPRIGLESNERVPPVPANRLLPTFEILQIFCYPDMYIFVNSCAGLRGYSA